MILRVVLVLIRTQIFDAGHIPANATVLKVRWREGAARFVCGSAVDAWNATLWSWIWWGRLAACRRAHRRLSPRRRSRRSSPPSGKLGLEISSYAGA